MCSCISTLSSAIYFFLEVKEISPTPSLPRLSRHLWAPWSFFSSWTMRSSALSPASFYRWSNLLLKFTLFFAETKLGCESLCVCLRAGHNSIGETDREKQFHRTLTVPNLRWAGQCWASRSLFTPWLLWLLYALPLWSTLRSRQLHLLL